MTPLNHGVGGGGPFPFHFLLIFFFTFFLRLNLGFPIRHPLISISDQVLSFCFSGSDLMWILLSFGASHWRWWRSYVHDSWGWCVLWGRLYYYFFNPNQRYVMCLETCALVVVLDVFVQLNTLLVLNFFLIKKIRISL